MVIHSTYSLLPLVSGVFVLTLGFFVWLKKPKELLHILFLFYTVAVFLWLFGTFRMFNSIFLGDQIFWDRFLYVGVIFIPIVFYHFGVLYCDIKKQDGLVITGYLWAFIFLIFSQTDYFVKGVYQYSWGAHARAQMLHHLFLAYFFFYSVFFFVNLFIHYRRSEGLHKRQVKYMLIGYGILDLIGPLAFLPAYGIPIYPVIFLSAIPFVLFMAYAIIRYNALDVKYITVEVIVSMFNLVILSEIFFSKSYPELALRALAAVLVLAFSIILVKSVKKEIQRREQVTLLASSLEEANRHLSEMDRQKTEFLSIAAHQLRTPITIIRGYADLLTDKQYGRLTTEGKSAIKKMDETAVNMTKMTDEFLDITHIESGKEKFDFCSNDLNCLISGVVAGLAEQASKKGLKIQWNPKGRLEAVFDMGKIRNCVSNFLDNAIRYSDKGTVKIETGRVDDGIFLRVKDEGLGFTRDDQVNFFQKFFRGQNTKGVNVTGTGLGLFVCKKFIEAHHGRIWAKSAGLGKGSEFGFWIPAKAGKN